MNISASNSDATTTAYLLPVPSDGRRMLARGWLWLGLLALIGSGLFSILLVLSRTPGVNARLPVADFFRVALVVHVDLSVLVWFVAMAGLLWSLNARARWPALAWSALALCATGTLVMAVAPFVDRAEALMANYIPVLDGRLFIGGLCVFALGAAMLVMHAMFAAPRPGEAPAATGALQFGLNASAVAGAIALLAFGWSFALMPAGLEGKPYYEILFWGGGHALQFVWTLLMLVAWLWLAGALGARVPLSPRLVALLFALVLASVFVTPYAYLAYDIASVEHRNLHTWSMRISGGISIVPIMLALLVGFRTLPSRADSARPLLAALRWSMVLFAAGGLIGLFISGNNVKIPAHYHGSIVGVTLALMGLVYLLLPKLGYAAPNSRIARLQPGLYGVGQLLHIVGLVWSGGYGVQRKVSGAEQVLRTPSEIAAMGLMGLGGLIAIIGGVVFIVVVIRAMRTPVASTDNGVGA